MKKKQLTAVVLSLSILFTACKKEKMDAPAITPAPAAAKKLTSKTTTDNAGSTETTVYRYDGDGKATSMESTNNVWVYAYPNRNMVNSTQINKSTNAVVSEATYTLDAAGRVVHFESKTPAGTRIASEDYAYDADGYMNQITSVASGTTKMYVYTYVNGVCTKGHRTTNGVVDERYEYQVNSAKAVKMNLSQAIPAEYALFSLYGKQQQYPISEVKVFDKTGVLKNHYQLTQEIDAEGNMTKENFKSISGTYESNTVFQHQ